MAWRHWQRLALRGPAAAAAASWFCGPPDWRRPSATPGDYRHGPTPLQLLPSRPSHCEEAPRLRCGTIKLRDGRLLAFHQEGVGVPVFAFHGMGSSRLTWARSKAPPGIRLIAVDRPGYGGSSPPPLGYSYSAFVRDLAELADHLHLPRFCVAGHSSGGPYALAAAAELPERVVAAAAVSSDAPYGHPEAPTQLRREDDSSDRASSNPCGLYGREPLVYAEAMKSTSSGPDKAHAWKHGVLGWITDFTLERLPWSFVVEDICLGPRLCIWVGGVDIPAICTGAPFLQQLVAGSQLRVVEGGNHVFIREPEHLAAVMTELKTQWEGAVR